MKNLLLIISFTCISILSFAQNIAVRGVVTDSASKQPVDIATVNLKSAAGQVIRTAATRQDGVFSFDKLASGKYALTMIRIGYASKSIDIDLTNAISPILDLGNIQFNPQANQLATISVTADKPVVKQEIDKLTYDLQADPESKINSVLDMMRKVPMLAVDGDDNIELNGSTNYKIFINGKPSGMVERDPKNILKSMPASTIQSIEVITNPPAKYDAEGLGGIINIVTIRIINNGYNGTANVGWRAPVSAGPTTGIAFSLKQGKFGLSLNGSGNLPNNPIFRTSIKRVTTGASPTELTQVNQRDPNAINGNIRTELSYEIDSLNLISGSFYISDGYSDIHFINRSSLKGSTGIIQSYRLDNDNDNYGGSNETAFNYQLGFRNNKARLLTFSYRHYKYNYTGESDLKVSERINYNLPDYRQYSNSGMSERTFQADYVHPLKKLSIEGGFKGIIRDNASTFEYRQFNSLTGKYEIDPTRSNKFDNTQNVYGAYNSYTYSDKNWGFKVGARIEFTTLDADFVSTSSSLSKNFFNIVPSASIQLKLKNMSSFVLGYNQRINRPSIDHLNPFVDHSNPDFEVTGNPDLKPALANNFQLSYSRSKKASLNMTAGFNFSNDMIIQVVSVKPGTNITRSSYENNGKTRMFLLGINLGTPVAKNWNVTINGQGRYGRMQVFVNNLLVNNQGFTYGGSMSSSYNIKGWRFNLNASANSPGLGLQARSNSSASWSLSASKDIVKDKLTFSALINNPFDRFRNSINESFGPDFTQTTTNQVYLRTYNVSLNYRFGKLKDAINRNKRGINNDDL